MQFVLSFQSSEDVWRRIQHFILISLVMLILEILMVMMTTMKLTELNKLLTSMLFRRLFYSSGVAQRPTLFHKGHRKRNYL